MAVLTVKTLPYLIIREASRRNEVDPVPADSSVVSAVIPTSLFSGKLPILVLTACQMALKGCNYFADEHYFISPPTLTGIRAFSNFRNTCVTDYKVRPQWF